MEGGRLAIDGVPLCFLLFCEIPVWDDQKSEEIDNLGSESILCSFTHQPTHHFPGVSESWCSFIRGLRRRARQLPLLPEQPGIFVDERGFLAR